MLTKDEKWLLSGAIFFLLISLFAWWGIKNSFQKPSVVSSHVEEFLNGTLSNLGIGERNVAEKFSEEKDGKIITHETIVMPPNNKLIDKLYKILKNSNLSFSLKKKGKTLLLSIGKDGFITHILKIKEKRKNLPLVAIVIDDIGYGGEGDRMALNLPSNFTLSFLPQTPYAKKFSSLAIKKGFEVLIHQPMEGRKVDIHENPGLITCSMKKKEMEKIFEKNISTIRGATGMNNHEGSIFTANKDALKKFLPIVKEKNLFFLDSLTTPKSKVEEVGREYKVKILKRDVFLDNKKNSKYIKKQINELLSIAYRKGFAIGIAHSRPVTIKVLKEETKKMKGKISLVHLSSLL